MTNKYSAKKVEGDFKRRSISKRVAKQRLLRSDADPKPTPESVKTQLVKWAGERPPKVRNANNLGVKTGAKGKREQAAA